MHRRRTCKRITHKLIRKESNVIVVCNKCFPQQLRY
ncbi:rCG56308, partial [Rattus norvegicus]